MVSIFVDLDGDKVANSNLQAYLHRNCSLFQPYLGYMVTVLS